jgi:hypothetical protein
MPEPRQYTSGEAARLAVQVARAAARHGRGKSLGPVDRAITRIQDEACAREAAEDKARTEAEAKRAAEKAAKRAARKFW